MCVLSSIISYQELIVSVLSLSHNFLAESAFLSAHWAQVMSWFSFFDFMIKISKGLASTSQDPRLAYNRQEARPTSTTTTRGGSCTLHVIRQTSEVRKTANFPKKSPIRKQEDDEKIKITDKILWCAAETWIQLIISSFGLIIWTDCWRCLSKCCKYINIQTSRV